LKDAMQFVYFVDFGQGKLRAARVGEDPSMYFTSAGVGLRFELYEHLQGTIDWEPSEQLVYVLSNWKSDSCWQSPFRFRRC